ncbi:hypothetical protein [Lentzea flava]|uniref:YbaB/EbfC DNA-binding family protein n=1 Tax=Lentzea flava TaxID=103732 RepID=A0ABQ2UV24_9PSEU|nr:hypothetical protein [Lentzea flava]MCP2201223.1 hypothetical protein [Lentzea flava]GGU49759.1 hypothetical protein GCM10010178_48230 [Lentzea flava]
MFDHLRDLKIADVRIPPAPPAPAGPPPEPADSYQATDPSRSLWITVDRDSKVLRIEVSGTWEDRLPVAEFDDAVFMTYVNAVQMAAAAEAPARLRAAAEGPAEPSADDVVTDFHDWLADVAQRRAAIGQKLREIEENAAASADQGVIEVHGPYGLLMLRVRGGNLLGIATNTEALSKANAGMVQQALWEAFSDAGLTSPSTARQEPEPVRRPRRDDEVVIEDDLWKGFGSQ